MSPPRHVATLFKLVQHVYNRLFNIPKRPKDATQVPIIQSTSNSTGFFNQSKSSANSETDDTGSYPNFKHGHDIKTATSWTIDRWERNAHCKSEPWTTSWNWPKTWSAYTPPWLVWTCGWRAKAWPTTRKGRFVSIYPNFHACSTIQRICEVEKLEPREHRRCLAPTSLGFERHKKLRGRQTLPTLLDVLWRKPKYSEIWTLSDRQYGGSKCAKTASSFDLLLHKRLIGRKSIRCSK